MCDAERAAERAARTSYGRLVAILAARVRDVAAAEDALGEAFRAALATWPRDGVPARPEAWLLTAARRHLGHGARHARVRAEAEAAVRQMAEAGMAEDGFADERLKLLFVCAHPAIDPAIHTPLMLQTVLGLDAARIAASFVMAPAAMGQRLVRAKAKIRDAGIRFAVPEPEELAERLPPVLEAVYAAFGRGWDETASALAEEAIVLARLIAQMLPGEAEAHGLLALLLHCHARRGARRDAAGRFVPLDRQETALWDAGMVRAAEASLRLGFALGRVGRFQLEAAIQSAHAARLGGAGVAWPSVVALYDALLRVAPTLGAAVGRAAAVAEAGEPARALVLLDAIAGGARYQPWWAVRGHVLARLGGDARAAFLRAAEMTPDPAARAFLVGRADGLGGVRGGAGGSVGVGGK